MAAAAHFAGVRERLGEPSSLRVRLGVGCVCDWVALWQVQIVEYIERLKDLAAISCSARAR